MPASDPEGRLGIWFSEGLTFYEEMTIGSSYIENFPLAPSFRMLVEWINL